MKNLKLGLIATLSISLAACGGAGTPTPVAPGTGTGVGTGTGTGTGTTPAETSAAYGVYAQSLPGWTAFSPPIASENKPGEAKTELNVVEDGVKYDCTTTPYTLTETPEQIVTFDPDSSIFWPGVLLQGKGYKDGIGSLAELPVRQRAPLQLSIDLPGKDVTRTVLNPDGQSVSKAIGELIQAAKEGGVQGGTSIAFSKEESNSTEQSTLKLGMSAKYLAASAKASLSTSRSANEHTIMARFIEKAYTIRMVLPQKPNDVFSKDFTQGVLDDQIKLGRIGKDNIPTYVASITYGRVMMFSFTSTGSASEVAAAFNAVYDGKVFKASADLSAEQKRTLANAKISVASVGGQSVNVSDLIKSGKLEDYFLKETSIDSYKPISYEVRNLGDNSIAKVSETTKYNIKECNAQPLPVPDKYQKVVLNFSELEGSIEVYKLDAQGGRNRIAALGDNGAFDITPYLEASGETGFVIGNVVDTGGVFTRAHRKLRVTVSADGEQKDMAFDECKGCHSADIYSFSINKKLGLYRRN
jgi:Thiol-activated cytolysin